jgi:hypothetical protein
MGCGTFLYQLPYPLTVLFGRTSGMTHSAMQDFPIITAGHDVMTTAA